MKATADWRNAIRSSFVTKNMLGLKPDDELKYSVKTAVSYIENPKRNSSMENGFLTELQWISKWRDLVWVQNIFQDLLPLTPDQQSSTSLIID